MKNRKWPLGSIMSLSMLVEGKWAEYAAMGLDTCQVSLPFDLAGTQAERRALIGANESLPMVSMILSWGEPGQETPVAMKRAILDSGAPNLGINLDPANLMMYGKANPVDAVGIFGEYVRSVHIKDGRYPTGDMKSLGNETAVGEGMVDFPALLHALEQAGFNGPLVIEREISGPRQVEDVRRAIAYIVAII